MDEIKEWTDYFSYFYDFCLRFWSPSALGGYFVQIAVLWGHTGCRLSGVERCPLLGGSKCTISMGRAIRGMEFVHCTEVVHLTGSLSLEVSLYTIMHVLGLKPGVWPKIVCVVILSVSRVHWRDCATHTQ